MSHPTTARKRVRVFPAIASSRRLKQFIAPRRGDGRRLRRKPQVRQNLLNYLRLFDDGEELKVDIKVCRRAETLHEGDSTRCGVGLFDARLLDKMRGDDALDHTQHRREQLRMHGKQAAQRDGERQRAWIRTSLLA